MLQIPQNAPLLRSIIASLVEPKAFTEVRVSPILVLAPPPGTTIAEGSLGQLIYINSLKKQ